MSVSLDPPRSKAVAPLSLLIIAVFIAGLVGTFAVGDGGGSSTRVVSGDEAKLVPAAADTTAQAGSAKFEMTYSAELAQGQKLESTSTGAFDFVAHTATIDQHATLPASFGTIDSTVLVDGTNAYLGGSTIAKKLPAGKKFVKMPLPTRSSLSNTTNTPADVMTSLRSVSSTITEVGQESVRGTNTTHYSFTIDGAKAYQGAGPNVAIPADVWLDSSGRLRRMHMTVDLGAFTGSILGSVGKTFTVNMELFDFGTEVRVSAPPPDQVVDGGAAGIAGLSPFGTP